MVRRLALLLSDGWRLEAGDEGLYPGADTLVFLHGQGNRIGFRVEAGWFAQLGAEDIASALAERFSSMVEHRKPADAVQCTLGDPELNEILRKALSSPRGF
jgi:hypothetical protein